VRIGRASNQHYYNDSGLGSQNLDKCQKGLHKFAN